MISVSSSKKSSKGFTLIELLIVMVLVGLVVSLTAPVLYNQYEKSKLREEQQKLMLLSGYIGQLAYYNQTAVVMNLDGRTLKARFESKPDNATSEQDESIEPEDNLDTNDVLYEENFKTLFFEPTSIRVDGNGNYSILEVKATQHGVERVIQLQSIGSTTKGHDTH